MKWMYFLLVTITPAIFQSTGVLASADESIQAPSLQQINIQNQTLQNSTNLELPSTTSFPRTAAAKIDDEKTEPILKNSAPKSTLILNSQNVFSGKSSNELYHHGVAQPMSIEEMERELAATGNNNVMMSQKDSSTSKDGISTWILLSGTNPTAQPNQKIDKISKVRDNGADSKKAATTKPSTTTTVPSQKKKAKVTTTTTTTSRPIENKSDQNTIVKKSKHPKNSTVTTSTELTTEATIIETTTKEVPVPFLVLEPKDADFDLPQDRSPGKPTSSAKKPKRPVKNSNTKNGNKKPVNNKTGVKLPNKNKENPIGTKIYNYLSREVMPTVGVGLLGLVVTAGLAGYFFGPLSALRRSYDVADRKDDLYYYNNEEYAGTDGQSEEEIFGKVIAGMPVGANYRNNIRYTPNTQQQDVHQRAPNRYQPNNNNVHNYPPKYNYRNINNGEKQPKFQQQQHRMQQSQPQTVPSNHNSAAQLKYPQLTYTNYQPQNRFPQISQKSLSSSIVAMPPPILSSTTLRTTALPLSTVDITSSTYEQLYSTEKYNSEDAVQIIEAEEPQQITHFVVGSVLPMESNIHQINNDIIDSKSLKPEPLVMMPEHGPRRRKRSIVATQKVVESELEKVEAIYNELKQRLSKVQTNSKINKEVKHIDYEMVRLRRVIAEIRDIKLFQQEIRIPPVNNVTFNETITNGILRITEDIKFVNELLDSSSVDVERKLAERSNMLAKLNIQINDTLLDAGEIISSNNTNNNITLEQKIDHDMSNETINLNNNNYNNNNYNNNNYYNESSNTTGTPGGLMGFLKLIELKAAFGINILRSIRPAFNRAFDDVYRSNVST